MEKVKSVKALPGYRLEVVFQNGNRGELQLEKKLFGPVFEPLKDPRFFSKAMVDEFGVICWPNGADIAPEAVFEEAVPYKA
jgi:hypothetical protein